MLKKYIRVSLYVKKGSKMDFNEATLIQNVEEYVYVLEQHLKGLEEHYSYQGCNKEDVVKWVLSEELENIYGIEVAGHARNNLPYSHIHNCLAATMEKSLSVLTNQLIAFPRLYGDLITVKIKIRSTDLYIQYLTPINLMRF